jgi:hypothetical protein
MLRYACWHAGRNLADDAVLFDASMLSSLLSRVLRSAKQHEDFTMKAKWIVVIAMVVSSPVLGQHAPRVTGGPPVVLSETQGVGCVWYRQRLDCSRYCYVEVNGKRYCREREREAHPQGLIESFGFSGPLK